MNREFDLARKERDYSTLKLWTVDWQDFNDSTFLRRVKYIHGFDFRSTLSGLGRWNPKVVDANRFALRVLNSVEEALDEAGFVNLTAVESTVEEEGVLFRYLDTEYAFDLSFRGDGSIHLRRLGSTLETFHRWYTGLMPSLPAILMRAMAALDLELDQFLRGASTDGKAYEITEPTKARVKLLRASFSFQVTLHSFRDMEGVRCKNLDVIRKNLTVRVPDASGRISEENRPLEFNRYGRMDYRVNLIHDKEPSISQFLGVEGPSNADWRALFFDLSYVGEAYTSADGSRQKFDESLFLSSARCADAYISFFRDIALEGFVKSVLEDFEFETTADVIA